MLRNDVRRCAAYRTKTDDTDAYCLHGSAEKPFASLFGSVAAPLLTKVLATELYSARKTEL
jgi:hypothetical protein